MINIYELFNTKSPAAASNNANSLIQLASGLLFYNKEYRAAVCYVSWNQESSNIYLFGKRPFKHPI